ncbi:aminotransferase class I/II-fold pyridoxal phosphate-dependent enzyme [bacterium]|nr:aminotransferase class I/II-fold pyridoxal phosphate-dependent enzyme [bacterium]
MSLISLLKKKTDQVFFTTPSHSGKFFIFNKFYQWYKADISEIETLNPEKALALAEKKASTIYNTKYTKFLTNGSTSGVISAILASKPKKILIWDKAHPCHKNGAILSGAEIIEYNLPFDENLGLFKAITLENVQNLVKKYLPDVLVITSPTYEGFVANIKEISIFCKEKDITLIVDEAHGALYPFSDNLPESAVRHADFIIQSLHKTAGGINPTALLHSNNIDPSETLKMITTTSPSYPMLATIEANIKFLNSKRGKKHLENIINNIKSLNIPQINDDITKILLINDNISEKLFNTFGIEDERSSNKYSLLLCGIGTSEKKLLKLKKVLKKLNIIQ